MAKWILKDKYQGEMIVTMDGSEWANAKFAAITRLKEKGEEVNDDSVAQLALNTQLDSMFMKGVNELGLVPVSMPDVDLRALTADSVTVSFTFALKPEVKVGDYSGLRYKVEEVNITDEDVEAGIKVYLESKARVVKEGGEKIVPELTDEFAKNQQLEGVTNVEEFRSYIKRTLAHAKRLRNQQEAEERLLDGLLAVTEVEVPDKLVEGEIGTMVQNLNFALAQQEIKLEDYIKAKGQDEEAFIKELWPTALKNVKSSLALEQVAKDHNLYPTNEEIDGEYRAMAIKYETKIDEVKNNVPVSEMSYQLLLSKALEYLKSVK